jgi:hypothetical protein
MLISPMILIPTSSFSYVYHALVNWQVAAALREAPEKTEEKK